VDQSDTGELAANPVVQRIISSEIKALINARTGFRYFEMIHGWRLVSKPFEVGDELTNTFKLKRHVITAKYAGLIDDIYRGDKERARAQL